MASLLPGTVVLARYSKHCFWPALLQAPTTRFSCPVLFFGDRKEATIPLARLRPFSDYEILSASQRPQGQMADTALREARAWDEGTTTAVAESTDWKINGTIIPAQSMKRAGALEDQVTRRLDLPVASFRVRPLVCTPDGVTDHDGNGDGDDDDASDDALSRRHAPLEKREFDGFFAHPLVGLHLDVHAHHSESRSACRTPESKPRALLSEGWRVDGHEWISQTVCWQFGRALHTGTCEQWRTAEAGRDALWRIVYDDGDVEDFTKENMLHGLQLFRSVYCREKLLPVGEGLQLKRKRQDAAQATLQACRRRIMPSL